MPVIHDISQTLRPDLPVWPGDTSFNIQKTWGIDDDCPVNVSRMVMSTHSGTHADAPLHYDKAGIDSAQSALEPYVGPALLLDMSDEKDDFVTCRALEAKLPANVPARVLIRTYKNFPHNQWIENFKSVEDTAIKLLGERGVKLIGVDSPSLDPQDAKNLKAHQMVYRYQMAILEGLVFDHVVAGAYTLIAVPLKIEGADASPVRAILLEDEQT